MSEQLQRFGTPSASVAIVAGGRIVFAEAFGSASLEPPTRASASMRYAIGSISKQFVAAALLMLQEDGRLSLDDTVGQHLPGVGPASRVTLRQLLSHTAGVRDYWPQDYVFQRMLQPIIRDELLNTWALKPLDFQPGRQWEYSNTGYVLAGAVLETVTGERLFPFLKRRIFDPLEMKSVIDVDQGRLAPDDAVAHTRIALGPHVPASKEGSGWLYAAGGLAMTAQDLARWDISLIQQSLLKPESYGHMARDTLLTNGTSTGYGLGMEVSMNGRQLRWSHSGAVSGFISTNIVFPEAGAAVVVLTNSDASDAASSIADEVARMLIKGDPLAESRTAQARQMFDELREGRIDRSLLSDNANLYFTPQALRAIASSLMGTGRSLSISLRSSGWRGGMDVREYEIRTEGRTLFLVTRSLPDGKFEQYQIRPG